MNKCLLAIMLLIASSCIAQIPTEPVPPAYPAELHFNYSKTVEIADGQQVDIKSYIPGIYSDAAAEFEPMAVVNGVASVRILFPSNGVPILVTGPTTMMLHWND